MMANVKNLDFSGILIPIRYTNYPTNLENCGFTTSDTILFSKFLVALGVKTESLIAISQTKTYTNLA